MNTRLFLGLTIALVATAIVTGLLIVGGPMQGRKDTFDEHRLQELNALAGALLCESSPRTTNRTLPEKLSVQTMREHCSGAGIEDGDLTDNETGEPYVYNRQNDRDFSVCAKFHDAERTIRLSSDWRGASFDPNTGCMSGRIR